MSMMFKKIVLSSLLAFSTISLAKVHLLPIKCNNTLLTSDPIIIGLNETQIRVIGNLRIESSVTNDKNILLHLSFKDSEGKFVTFYRSEPLKVVDGDEIGIASSEGFSLTLKVAEVN
jgi:hypothetical protein